MEKKKELSIFLGYTHMHCLSLTYICRTQEDGVNGYLFSEREIANVWERNSKKREQKKQNIKSALLPAV